MVSVLCFGKEWHGDDGFGMAVYQLLKKRPLPSGVNLVFAGTHSAMVWNDVINSTHVILVDACQSDEPEDLPGTLRWSDPESFSNTQQRNLHDGGLEELIRHRQILADNEALPTIEILLVFIESISAFHKGLSHAVNESLPLAVDMLINQIQTKANME